MVKPDQKGFIAQLFLFLLLLAGLGVSIYLVQTRTGWFSKAAPVTPTKPETSFELEAQADTSPVFADVTALKSVGVGQRFRVDIWARSDIDAANLFEAKIKFPTDLLQVVEINKRGANSFVNQWIADPSFDNSSGNISIIGGVNAPGLLTSTQNSTSGSNSVKGVSTAAPVDFNTRAMYVGSDGTRTESITAHGKYWNFNSPSGGIWNAVGNGDLTSVSRYANGPCSGLSVGTCDFDSRTMYVGSDGSRTESITAYGKYWNFNSANGWAPMDGNGNDLTTVSRYANGPCQGHSPCVFDTRAMYVGSDGSRTESITAYGKYWNFNSANGWAPMDGNGSDLNSVGRYANGPCSGHSPCVFSSRTMYVNPDGTRTESITAYGKYWNFNSANGWAPMDGNGSDLTSVSRYVDILITRITIPTPLPRPTPVSTQPTLMVPRLMASIIFEAKKVGNASIDVTDGSQILRNSDSLNIISAKKGITLHVTSAPVSAPIGNGGSEFVCTNIAAPVTLGKLPSGEDSYVVTGTKTVQLGVNASPFAKITWKQLSSFALSSLNSNPTTMTVASDGTYEVGATANWENPSATANCPNISVTFKSAQSAATRSIQPVTEVPKNLRHDGDVNSDNKINLVDMSRLLAQFNQSGQSEADLNGDGIVNTIDVIKMRNILVKNGVLGPGR